MEWPWLGIEDLKICKFKAEYYVRQHQDNAVIAKLKGNVPLDGNDVRELERILWSEVGTKAEYEALFQGKALGIFVREIVGMDMHAAKEAFAEYLDDARLSSDRIYFVNQIIEYIVQNGVMENPAVLQSSPFNDNGSVVELFGSDMQLWEGIRGVIARRNGNALAA